MSEHVSQTIQMIHGQIRDLERDLSEKKRMVNYLCGLAGQPPLYPESSLETSGIRPIRSDEYYGQPLATAMRMVLERRQAGNLGPANVGEIYDALVAGGYKFDTKNQENAKRGLYNALTKNSTTFHKLQNGGYGLLEWYPGVKEAKNSRAEKTAKIQDDDQETFGTDADADAAEPEEVKAVEKKEEKKEAKHKEREATAVGGKKPR